jgi:hypothetical protein
MSAAYLRKFQGGQPATLNQPVAMANGNFMLIGFAAVRPYDM